MIECIVGNLSLIFRQHITLAAGLRQAKEPEIGISFPVRDGKIIFFHWVSFCSRSTIYPEILIKIFGWEVFLLLKI